MFCNVILILIKLSAFVGSNCNTRTHIMLYTICAQILRRKFDPYRFPFESPHSDNSQLNLNLYFLFEIM